jgi:hypothetical protein
VNGRSISFMVRANAEIMLNRSFVTDSFLLLYLPLYPTVIAGLLSTEFHKPLTSVPTHFQGSTRLKNARGLGASFAINGPDTIYVHDRGTRTKYFGSSLPETSSRLTLMLSTLRDGYRIEITTSNARLYQGRARWSNAAKEVIISRRYTKLRQIRYTFIAAVLDRYTYDR